MTGSSSTRRRALLVHQDPGSLSARVRILQMAPYLVAEGIECECVQYPRGIRNKKELFSSLPSYDVVILQRELPDFADAFFWQRCTIPIIFDYDEALIYLRQPEQGSFESKSLLKRFQRIVEASSGVIAANDYLASLASKASKRVLVLPSAVPHEVAQKQHAAPPEGKLLKVGWIGQGRDLDALAPLQDTLNALFRTHPFELTVVSDSPCLLLRAEFKIKNIPWTLDSQEELVSEFDIGIAPMGEETPYSRGQSSYRALQYMAARVPVVGSDVAANRELISDETGFLASTSADWISTLQRLLDDVQLRSTTGAAGRRFVEERFTYGIHAPKLAEFIRASSGTQL